MFDFSNKNILVTGGTGGIGTAIAALFDQFYSYVQSANTWVRQYVCAAEELQDMDEREQDGFVMVLAGKRSFEEQAREQQQGVSSRQFDGQGSSSAGFAGTLGRRGEVCLLCPQSLADESCQVTVRARGGALHHIPIEHRAFDALYHVLVHPDGHVGWEDHMPRRTEAQAFQSLHYSAISLVC